MKLITSNANDRIPVEVQLMMWHLYDSMKANVERDYLQIFELSVDVDGSQKILHSQEVPEWNEECTLLVTSGIAVNEKVYIIKDELEDGIVETMLLAEDY